MLSWSVCLHWEACTDKRDIKPKHCRRCSRTFHKMKVHILHVPQAQKAGEALLAAGLTSWIWTPETKWTPVWSLAAYWLLWTDCLPRFSLVQHCLIWLHKKKTPKMLTLYPATSDGRYFDTWQQRVHTHSITISMHYSNGNFFNGYYF